MYLYAAVLIFTAASADHKLEPNKQHKAPDEAWYWPDQCVNVTEKAEVRQADTQCKTATGAAGTCVPAHLCSANHTVIRDGAGLLDKRAKSQAPLNIPKLLTKCHQSGVCDTGCLCCSLEEAPKTDVPTTAAPSRDKEERMGCGWRYEDGVGFLITIPGLPEETRYGEFPWMVAVLILEPIDEPGGPTVTVYSGGGSLIHPSVVLTAAQHVQLAWSASSGIRIRAGDWDLATTNEIYPHQERTVVDVLVHKDFNQDNLYNDIALLFVDPPFIITPNIGLICLPPPMVEIPAATQCIANFFNLEAIVILKKVKVPIVPHAECQTRLRSTRLGEYFRLHSSFICAGGEKDKDTCVGDVGSPLVCPIKGATNRYMQCGMVSWGVGCGTEGVPGVYTDLTSPRLRDWIDAALRCRQLDTSVYVPS